MVQARVFVLSLNGYGSIWAAKTNGRKDRASSALTSGARVA